MRTLEEVQKELDEVDALIKAQQEGMPNYGDPGYRAARFDYIVEGDRSGLDAYQNALNAAIQNKLSRESSEKMAKEGKAQASLEENDDIMLHLNDADAVVDDLKKRNYADDSVEMRKAKNQLDHWVKRAERKGLNVSLYRDTPKPPAESNTPAAAASQTAPQGRSYEDLSNYLTTIKDDKSVNRDTVKALRAELDLHKDKVPFSKMSESINLLNAKDKELADSEWNEYNSRVKAALGEKDYAKRKAALEPLKEELAKYKGQEKYAEVEKSINDGLKKPTQDNLKSLVLGQYTIDELSNISTSLGGESEGKKEKTLPVKGGRTAKLVRLKDGSLDVRNEKGNSVGTIPAKSLKLNLEVNTSNKIDTTKKNPIASVLTSSDTASGILPIAGDIW